MSGGEIEQRLEAPPARSERVNGWRGRWAAIRESRALEQPYVARAALALIFIAAAAFFWHETRSTTFWFDEWQWVLDRRGNTASAFLSPHNEHLSLVPIAVYRLLFATAGLTHYAPYRVVLIALDLVCAALLFVYARRRVGDFLALLATALLLFLGPAWQTSLWPFGMTYLLSLAPGLAALLMLDRRDRFGNIAAAVLLTVSLASSGIGVTFVLGAAVELFWTRARRRDWWVVGVPVLLYAIWWLGYQHSGLVRHDIVLTPDFVAGSAASVLAALLGLGGTIHPENALDSGTLLTWGAPLAIAALAAVVWRVARFRPIPPRVPNLIVVLLSFWVLTALTRAFISTSYTSRYLYVSGLIVLLLAVELVRGVRLRAGFAALLALGTAAAVVSNIGPFRDAGRFERSEAQLTAADLGALEIARPVVKPNYVLTMFPGVPFVIVHADKYFAAAKALGSPAATPAQLARAPGPARMTADSELIRIHGVSLLPATASSAGSARPIVDAAHSGSVAAAGSCVRFRAAAATVPGSLIELDVTMPPGGVSISTEGASASVSMRRFADQFQAIGQIAPGSTAALRVAPDRSAQPWHIAVADPQGATICGL